MGAINLKNNKAVCKDICDLLSEAPIGIKPDRTYVEFRDVPRENMVCSFYFHYQSLIFTACDALDGLCVGGSGGL